MPESIIENVGLGILSWHGYDSVRAALTTYRGAGFLDFFDEKVIFLPEMTEKGKNIAAEFGLKAVGTTQNLGIMGGFQAMAEAMTSDYLLLTENDYQLIVDGGVAHAALVRAVRSLESGKTNVWRFRHLEHPGDLFHIHKNKRYWPDPEASFAVRLVAATRRFLRPYKARRLSGFAPYIYPDPDKRFPHDIRRTMEGDYMVSSRILNWANNVFLIEREFFLKEIIPTAQAHIGGRLVNGFPTIETELNRSQWWRDQEFWIGVSNPGLFTHARQSDRGY